MRHGMTVVAFFTLLITPSSRLLAEAVDPSDATLYGVDFIDAQEGWAVGEQGTIWHTIDAGKSWDRQSVATSATLTTVRMDAPWSGMIGSRESLPFSAGSTGQIFRTRNGGVAWTPTVDKPQFGGVKHLWVGEEGRGFAIGESSDVHPSGVTVTSDGGSTWIPLRGPIDIGWTAALTIDSDHVLCASANGHVMLFHDLELSRDLDLQMPAGCAIRSFAKGGGRMWAVGDRCQVYSSGDSGMSWRRMDLPVPKEVGEQWDLTAITANGTNVWAVGRPGSIVLHSDNSGETWEIQKTSTPMPLHAVEFINETNGWAVGAMGTIVATTDGGKTWSTQRQGDHVASILWLLAHPENAPLGAVSMLGGRDGYRNVALSLCGPSADLMQPGSSSAEARFSEAIRAAGGTYAESIRSFTRPRPIMKPWIAKGTGEPSSNDARPAPLVERDLVLALRLWQPSIVILDGSAPSASEWNASDALSAVMQSAFDKASDDKAYPEQISVMGLSAAQCSKLLAVSNEPVKGDTVLTCADKGQKEDIGPLSMAALAQSRLNVTPKPITRQLPLRTLRAKTEDHTSLFAGMEFTSPDSPGRRAAALVNPDRRDREELLLTVEVKEFPTDPQEQRKILDDLLLQGGDPLSAGWALYELSQQLLTHDRPADAKRMLDYLIVRFPQHPYATPAYRWLITQQASDEVHCVDGKAVPIDSEIRQRELRLALAYGRKLQEDKHVLARDPAMSMLLASAARRLGQSPLARNYLSFAEESSLRWNPVAMLESDRLAHDAANPKLRSTTCCRASKAPVLDGQLNDACWHDKESITLASGDKGVDPLFVTAVKLRFDDKYLYVGAQCNAPADTPGDHLVVSLDIDRDYATFIDYSAEHVRCVTPSGTRPMSSDGLITKRQPNEKGWSLEMAIPLASLVGSREQRSKEAWGIEVRRVIPGMAVMTASQDRTTSVAQGEPCHIIEFNEDDVNQSGQPRPLRAN